MRISRLGARRDTRAYFTQPLLRKSAESILKYCELCVMMHAKLRIVTVSNESIRRVFNKTSGQKSQNESIDGS